MGPAAFVLLPPAASSGRRRSCQQGCFRDDNSPDAQNQARDFEQGTLAAENADDIQAGTQARVGGRTMESAGGEQVVHLIVGGTVHGPCRRLWIGEERDNGWA